MNTIKRPHRQSKTNGKMEKIRKVKKNLFSDYLCYVDDFVYTVYVWNILLLFNFCFNIYYYYLRGKLK